LALIRAFLTKYQEEGASSRAFTKKKHLKMTKHGSVWKYADKLLELVNKYESSTSASIIRDWFIIGLPFAINRFVRIQRPKVRTMEEALEAAQTYVDSKMSQEKQLKKEMRKEKARRRKWKDKKKNKSKRDFSSSETSSSSDSTSVSDSSSDSSSASVDYSSSSTDSSEEVKKKNRTSLLTDNVRCPSSQ
jgi:cobalamin biosynthesis Mg chelatase CobN